MDGRGLALGLWRNVKYEDVYLKGYANMAELMMGRWRNNLRSTT